MYNNDNTGSLLSGLLLAGIFGVAAVAAAASDDSDTDTGIRTSSYPITTPPRTQPLRPNYDRSTSYNPMTGRVTERREMRVDPRAYEVQPDYYRDRAAEDLIRRERALFSTLGIRFGYLDDSQITSIAKNMLRLGRNESLIVYKHMGRIYNVSTETLRYDRNAANQLKDFFERNRSMTVIQIKSLGTCYITSTYSASTIAIRL